MYSLGDMSKTLVMDLGVGRSMNNILVMKLALRRLRSMDNVLMMNLSRLDVRHLANVLMMNLAGNLRDFSR